MSFVRYPWRRCRAISSSFKLDANSLLNGLKNFETKSEAAIHMYAENSALKLQNYAREHRPWTDRTGHARQRLTGSSSKVTKGYQLILSHGVDYGVWLELAHEKRFAIIQPTIVNQGPGILEGLSHLIDRLSLKNT